MSSTISISEGDNQGSRHPENPIPYEPFYEKATTGLITETQDGSYDLNDQSKLFFSTKMLDPLQVLPPELALQCLLESLPSDSYFYTSAVFELVSVSTRWRYFILSSQVLWQEIHLMLGSHDLFTTISTFVHFSGTNSLDIIVWGDVRPELSAICSILLPHKNRIHRLMFRPSSQTRQSIGEMRSWCMPMAAQIIGSLGSLSNLKEVDFGPDFLPNYSQIESLFLPPTTYITSPFALLPLMEDMGHIGLQRITKVNTTSHIDNLVPSLESLKNLTGLSLHRTSDIPPTKTPVLTRASSHLRSILYHQSYCANLEQLLRLTSSQLTYLDLEIPLLKLEALVENLESLGSLNGLYLKLTNWSEPVPLISTICTVTITALHTMEISSRGYGGAISGYNAQPIVWLFETFKTLYPMVKRISLNSPKDILHFADHYLESLRYLEWIGVALGTPHRKIFLPSLQSLRCSPAVLAYLDAPNLLSLSVVSVTQTSILDDLRMSNLRKLVVRTDLIHDVDLNFDGSQYPNLHEITISMNSHKHKWKLSSFSQLSSITLRERGHLSTHGTHLCTSLIYNPETCPSLKHLHLSSFVEWDILFLMLQRRNFEAKGVSKISSLSQGYVPPILQRSLSALLEGTSVNVLDNDDLQMEATREVICDPNM